jgi:hypothetical protein
MHVPFSRNVPSGHFAKQVPLINILPVAQDEQTVGEEQVWQAELQPTQFPFISCSPAAVANPLVHDAQLGSHFKQFPVEAL